MAKPKIDDLDESLKTVIQNPDAVKVDGITINLEGIADDYILYYDSATDSIRGKVDEGGGGGGFSMDTVAFPSAGGSLSVSATAYPLP